MQIPQNVEISLTSKEKNQKLLTDTAGGWYMAKSARGLTPLKRTKLSKKHKKRRIIFKRNYMKLIGVGMIGNSNCIEKGLNGLILNLPPK